MSALLLAMSLAALVGAAPAKAAPAKAAPAKATPANATKTEAPPAEVAAPATTPATPPAAVGADASATPPGPAGADASATPPAPASTRCPCEQSPPRPPTNEAELACCDAAVLGALIRSDFRVERPELTAALCGADAFMSGAEEQIIAARDGAEGPHQAAVERVAAMLRISADRVRIALSYRAAPRGGRTAALDALAARAERRLARSFVDAGNLVLGAYWDRAVELSERYRGVATASGPCGAPVDDGATPEQVFAQAEDYFARALAALGRSLSATPAVRARILADRATLRVAITPGAEGEATVLEGALDDAAAVVEARLGGLRFIEQARALYGEALAHRIQVRLERGERAAALTLAPRLAVPFGWARKEHAYLLLARDAALATGRRELAVNLLGAGYQLVLRRLDVSYLNLAEGYPQEFFGRLLKLEQRQLRIDERGASPTVRRREKITSQLFIAPTDCEVVTEYVRVLCTLGSPENLTQAKSLLSRIRPGLCPGTPLEDAARACPGVMHEEG